ncbi:MAG TPA: PPOX class F420-dependent oxidoreductase [Streptosporangiaceae bacterium]|nr:PPOX class F420-dependent oxidoreductase [Streptosporangiaceae bacterium]
MLETACPPEAADGGSFTALASARYLQVTTFGRDGRPVPARVRWVADGDRFYFGARTWSGTVKRLRHADAVHVAPCGALGVCYGPPLDATARLLPAGEASRAATELARKYPVRRGAAHLVASRGWRPAMVYYELVADDAGDDQDPYPQDRPAPAQRAGSHAARGSLGSGPCQIRRTRVTDHGAGSIASIWPAPVEAPPRKGRQEDQGTERHRPLTWPRR